MSTPHRKKKSLTGLPTEKVIKKLFPKEAISKAKKIAHEKEKAKRPMPKR